MTTHGSACRLRVVAAASAGCLIAGFVALSASAAHAYDVVQTKIVTDNPADFTPDVVSDGGVRYLAQAGSTMIAVGNFSQVRNHGSSTVLTRHDIFSFDATTGALNTSFAPNIDAMTHVVVASPDNSSVYVGGEFHHVNGATAVALAEINLSTGALVSSFKPLLDGRVETMKLVG